MRIFLAGATGAIGRRLVPMLLGAGHEVTGMTRSRERAAALREQGVRPAVCDAFDAEALRRTVADARPQIVVHQLTDIPRAIDPRKVEEQFATNDRLRVEGTRNLMRAAEEAGAARMVSQSIAFAYAPAQTVRAEDDPLFDDAPDPWRRTVAAVRALEEQTVGSAAVEGVVLRYGYFYGPGTAYAPDGATAETVRRRRFPIVGSGSGVYSFVHVDDAAAATVLALDRGSPGIYNVVDDEPAAVREWLPAYAHALGVPPPRRVPRVLARLVAGRLAVYLMTDLQGATNAKARRELGWSPSTPSWREGFEELRG